MIINSQYTAYLESPTKGTLKIPISSFSVRISLRAEQRSVKIHSLQNTVEWVPYLRPVVTTYIEIVTPSLNLITNIARQISDSALTTYKILSGKTSIVASVSSLQCRTDEGSRKSSISLSGEVISYPWTHTSLPTKQVIIVNCSYVRRDITVGVRCGLNNDIRIGEYMVIDGIPYRVTQLTQWTSDEYGSMELTAEPISFGFLKY